MSNEKSIFGSIIVDGPDAVGKTEFSKFIKQNYGFESVHSDAHCDNDYNYHHKLLTDGGSKFCDRFMAGEYVYPKIYGREPKLNVTEMTKLFDEIVNTNSLYVMMNTSDTDILIRRLAERKEFNYFKEIIPQVNYFREFTYVFEDYFNKYKTNFYIADIAEPDAYDKLYAWAKERIDYYIGGGLCV